MAGIFDSIIDGISGLDESDLFKGGAAAFKAMNGSKSRSSGLGELHSLNDGMMNGLSFNNPVQATKSNPNKSVDPDTMYAEWYSRLNRFASMQGSTSVKPR